MTITFKADHEDQAVGNLISQFKTKSVFEAVIRSYVAELQELEVVFQQIVDSIDVDTATDAQLTVLGAIVGEQRQGRADDAYRVAIKVRILLNKSNGTAEEVREIMRTFAGDFTIRFSELYPAAFVARIIEDFDFSTIDAAELGRVVSKARGTAINSQTIAMPANRFKFSTTGQGFGAGKLGGVF